MQMEKVTRYLEKTKKAAKKMIGVRVRKHHLDYIAGLLSIPVLLTAVVLNFGNLHRTDSSAPTPSPQVIIVSQPPTSPSDHPTEAVCKKTIGPISITYPQEGQSISDNPVCITIDYTDTNYCSVVWSYRTNSNSWSDFNTNAPCLYNLPNGNVQFQLRVNSTVSSATTTLTRNFVYNGGNTSVITPAPTIQPTLTPAPTNVIPPTSAPSPTPVITGTSG